MSSGIWTRDELLSSPTSYEGECWRFVEAQHKVSTAKLSDNGEDQVILEDLIEKTKPKLPLSCSKLDFLLAASFRYSPYPVGSRFRRANQTEGAYYASETIETAASESAFYRLLFFIESPGTPWPSDASELTAFSVDTSITKLLDLCREPFVNYRPVWTHLTHYEQCQALADEARKEAVQAIKYESVRDPNKGFNIVLLTPDAFSCSAPIKRQTWRMILNSSGVRALCEFPIKTIDFGTTAFSADPRVADFDWKR